MRAVAMASHPGSGESSSSSASALVSMRDRKNDATEAVLSTGSPALDGPAGRRFLHDQDAEPGRNQWPLSAMMWWVGLRYRDGTWVAFSPVNERRLDAAS